MSTRIVFLNGTPSSGKSTLARAIHPRLEQPTYYRSLDDFLLGIQSSSGRVLTFRHSSRTCGRRGWWD